MVPIIFEISDGNVLFLLHFEAPLKKVRHCFYHSKGSEGYKYDGGAVDRCKGATYIYVDGSLVHMVFWQL